MRYRVIPYRAGSRGATALARALGGMCLRLNGSRFRPTARDLLINWGNTDPPFPNALNGRGIRDASNKLHFFQRMVRAGQADIIPAFWTNRNDIPADAYPIVCRTVLAGHSGDGIVIANTPAELVNAPLYVQYVKKQDEYRVHVGKRGGGSVIIAIQQKRRSREVADENVNWQVRNHQNGFIYAREGVNPPDAVRQAAQLALVNTDLDFGAVDVIYNQRTRQAYVLEINTAPGLEGQTVTDYVNFFTGVN